MKINTKNMGIIIIVVIFAGIWATIAAGVWTTESNKIPATYKEGVFEGLYNPEDIRGSYTFKEVSELFEIDLDVLYKAFGLENINSEEFKSKDLEGLYAEAENEIGNGSVQVFVALYKDLPIVLEDTYLPEQSVEIILENNKNITEEQLLYLKEHSVILPVISGDNLNEEPKEQTEVIKDETTEEENLVKGATTFKQVLDAGITKQQIEEILGMEMPTSNMAIKDFCLEKGLSFSLIKTKLNELSK